VPIRSRRRHRAQLSIAAVLVILLGVAGVGGLGFLVVKGQADSLQNQLASNLKSGQTELEAAKTSLKLANSKHDLTQVTAAKAHFTSAKQQFIATQKLADSSLELRGLEKMPVVGELARSRHVAVDGIAAMGIALCDAGQDISDLDAQLLKPTASGQQGQVLLSLLGQMGTSLTKIQGELQQADSAARSVDASLVPAGQRTTFLKAIDTIHSGLVGIEEFQKLVPVLTEILGGNGVRTYLIEQVNPAELRPGGGFIGSYSVLKADHGAITLVASGNSYELVPSRPSPGQRGYVAPPGPLHEFVPTASWSFVDSNFFPDFPSNAKAAEQFVVPQLKTPVDAVIAMDYYTVAAMLKVTGPMAVPGYPITVNADNIVPLLIQYDLEQGYTHKAILGAIAGPLFQRVLTVPPGQWPNLITTLSDLVTHRNLQVYFNDPAAQAEMDRFGWTGTLNPTHAVDYMMETEANLGGTKANYFVNRSYTLTLSHVGDALHHVVAVDVTDNMPYSYHPGDYYHGFATLYMPDKSSAGTANLTRGKYPDPSPPATMHMIDGWMTAIPGGGGHIRTVFSYDTPWQADDQGVAHIYWQKQPGTLNDKIQVSWAGPNQTVYTASSQLSSDQVINLGPGGVTVTVGQPAQAKLPSISLG
jgi:Protein of unknown function (DUF4012)